MRGRGQKALEDGGRRRRRTRYVGCWRTGHGGHRPTKEGDNVSKGQYSEASKGYHSRTRVSAPRPPLDNLFQLMKDEKRWVLEDGARRPSSY